MNRLLTVAVVGSFQLFSQPIVYYVSKNYVTFGHRDCERPLNLSISVVIPTFNRQDSLRRTLEGLARQILPVDLWEVVVVSDGSTDGTDELLRDYAQTAPFMLRPIVQPNAGPSMARNRGIEEAKGEIIVFLDDDVEPCPEFLATHLRHHEADRCVAVIGPLLPDPARRRQEPVWIGWEHAMLDKQYRAFRTGEWSSAGPNHFYSGNASVRRDHILAVGGFNTTFTRQEDVEMAYRMEKERGVDYIFDITARAFHRPLRTWDSWLNVPFAYGRLDVIRACRGDLDWRYLRVNLVACNRATRFLAQAGLVCPPFGVCLQGLFRNVAVASYNARRDQLAYRALSAVYNLHYLRGAAAELNSFDEVRGLVWGKGRFSN